MIRRVIIVDGSHQRTPYIHISSVITISNSTEATNDDRRSEMIH